jgi:tRNA (cytidine/uridine-2'-O-)-methyltransferase
MFHVILFEPEIPPNTGNAIRLCANTGARLHLIKPLGFRLDDKSLQRSGLDYHDMAAVEVHASLSACIAALPSARVFAVETSGATNYSDIAFQKGDAFLFGPETRGLPDDALRLVGAERCVKIPMQAGSRSINLSNSVALVVYEAWRQLEFSISVR